MTESTGFPPEPDLPLPHRTPGEALAGAQSAEDERGADVLINPVTPARPERNLSPLPEYTCGQCGETFGTNFAEDQIECAYCEARRCPHCHEWFGEERI